MWILHSQSRRILESKYLALNSSCGAFGFEQVCFEGSKDMYLEHEVDSRGSLVFSKGSEGSMYDTRLERGPPGVHNAYTELSIILPFSHIHTLF